MKSRAQKLLGLISEASVNEFDFSPGLTWLKQNGNQLNAVAQQLRKFVDRFENEVEYDANEDPHTEAIHSTIEFLFQTVRSVSIGEDFEAVAKDMINQGRYMLKELV